MASNLPDYVASAQPVPAGNRVAWFKSTAQTYAGIMLWFVFWQDVPSCAAGAGGALAHGIGVALAGLVLAALLCHFLYYLVPGMLGMKTGLPLYIVGTSTYGVQGGFLMPGFLMGLLQFGWLGVNAFFSSLLLVAPFFDSIEAATLSPAHMVLAAIWAIVAAVVGLKGIKYVASIATFLPLIPLVILIILCAKTISGVGSFEVPGASASDAITGTETVALTTWGVVAGLLVYIIGFFATAGAAGADFGMNNRSSSDVQLGGLFGIAGATILAGGLSLLIVAGAVGLGKVNIEGSLQTTAIMDKIVSGRTASVFMYLLAIAAFPPACFSSFIAANSFKTTLPKLSPWISVGLGTLVSIVLAVTGWAGDVIAVFSVIGASFGPICGAMAADYLMSGRKWAGPRAGFNPAGWISWAVGFIVGAADFFAKAGSWIIERLGGSPDLIPTGIVPVPPLAAFVVGFALYLVLAAGGLESKTLEMPAAKAKPEA